MEKEFVTYNLALRMKALGYDDPCMAAFEDNGKLFIYWSDLASRDDMFYSQKLCEKLDYECLAPTWQQAFRWFRDNYRIDSAICKHTGFKSKPYTLNIIKNDNDVICDYDNDEDLKTYNSYEEAELACLEKLIEIVEGYE